MRSIRFSIRIHPPSGHRRGSQGRGYQEVFEGEDQSGESWYRDREDVRWSVPTRLLPSLRPCVRAPTDSISLGSLIPLSGKNALLSIQLIESLGIYSSIVFFSTASQNTFASTSPSSSSPATPAPSATALSAALILDQILLSTASSLPPIHPTLLPARLQDKKERTRLFLTAFATPYRGLTVKPGKTVVSAPETVIKEVMKVSFVSDRRQTSKKSEI